MIQFTKENKCSQKENNAKIHRIFIHYDKDLMIIINTLNVRWFILKTVQLSYLRWVICNWKMFSKYEIASIKLLNSVIFNILH